MKINFEYKECIDISNIKGDGTYIGNIDTLIIDTNYCNDKPSKIAKIKLNNGKFYNCYKFHNCLPLIVDLVKKYFLIFKNYYNIVLINKEKYIIYEYEYEILLSDYLSKNDKVSFLTMDNIKRIIAFNWLMCIKRFSNIQDKIYVKSGIRHLTNVKECSLVMLITKPEKNYHWDVNNHNADISQNMLNQWFGGKLENFYSIVKEIIKGIDIKYFRSDIAKIINTYDNDYIFWSNAVIERLRFIKYY
jgi:hypothetical protein